MTAHQELDLLISAIPLTHTKIRRRVRQAGEDMLVRVVTRKGPPPARLCKHSASMCCRRCV